MIRNHWRRGLKMKTKIIAFANQKGGVGKSTTVLTVGKELARNGNKVLLIDLDPQATLTQVLGIEMSKEQKTVSDFMGILGEPMKFEDVVISLKDIDILSSNITLFKTEQVLVSKDNNANILKKRLEKIRGAYDFILIDCPPSLGLFMTNGLMASDYVVIPTKPEVASIMGIDLLIDTLYRLGESYDKEFDVAGILFTMSEGRTNAYKQVLEYMQEKAQELNTKVFNASIRRSVRCSESVGGGLNVVESESKVGEDYKKFVQELIDTVKE